MIPANRFFLPFIFLIPVGVYAQLPKLNEKYIQHRWVMDSVFTDQKKTKFEDSAIVFLSFLKNHKFLSSDNFKTDDTLTWQLNVAAKEILISYDINELPMMFVIRNYNDHFMIVEMKDKYVKNKILMYLRKEDLF